MMDIKTNNVYSRANTKLIIFFFNDTATTEIYTLSLHDALPIWVRQSTVLWDDNAAGRLFDQIQRDKQPPGGVRSEEHTSELQSDQISYAVFCLKKKKQR